MITEHKQKPGICYECDEKFLKDEKLKYKSNKIFHENCYKVFVSRTNGRPFPCPKCNSKDKDNNLMSQIGSKTMECDLCSGFGFVKDKMSIIHNDEVLFYKGKESGKIVKL